MKWLLHCSISFRSIMAWLCTSSGSLATTRSKRVSCPAQTYVQTLRVNAYNKKPICPKYKFMPSFCCLNIPLESAGYSFTLILTSCHSSQHLQMFSCDCTVEYYGLYNCDIVLVIYVQPVINILSVSKYSYIYRPHRLVSNWLS